MPDANSLKKKSASIETLFKTLADGFLGEARSPL